jgi:Ca2+-binding EF-hand superfamily protein
MKLALPMAAALALAAGAAYGHDKAKTGFDALDKNNDGYLTRAEAAGSSRLVKGFDVADKNNDGKLNRTEYLAATAKNKLRHAANKPANPDPGFNALDKNNDGYLSRAEARGNPYVSKRFKTADSNHDGKLNRAEYLAQMAKKDVRTGTSRAERSIDRAPSVGG